MSEAANDLPRQLETARGGCRQTLGELLEACRGYLLLIARQELDADLRSKGGASDIVQETLCDAVRGFEGFQGTTEEELRHWLRRILLNNLVSFARRFREAGKRAVDLEVSLEAGHSPPADDSTPSVRAIRNESEARIDEALQRLPEDYRRVLLLRYQEERSFEDIGRLLGLTPNAARKLWLRAVKRLQQETGSAG
jgi:RNA polymerase sigma-70 factor (ECF subfamily)